MSGPPLAVLVVLLVACVIGTIRLLPPTLEAHLGALCFGVFMSLCPIVVRAWRNR